MKLQLIRNATMKFCFDQGTILVDPCFAPKLSIYSYAGISKNHLVDLPLPIPEIIAGINAVIVSHIHSDHFEAVAQDVLPKGIPLFCQPGDEEKIRGFGFTSVKTVTEAASFNGISFQRFEGRHGSGDVLSDMGQVSGFFFQAPGAPSVCWLGDTILTPELEELVTDSAPDVVVTHSSGAVWGKERVKIVMDAEQTVRLCELLPRSRIVAVHMEALDHGTVSRADLRSAADSRGIPAARLIIPADGETVTL